jgi:PAS domain S-box-containing protein
MAEVKGVISPKSHQPDGFDYFSGDMGARVRAFDWSTTPLGPIETWPQSLRTAVSTMLDNCFPSIMAWGPKLTCLYNDAYRPLLGSKPEALGKSILDVWAEARDLIGPMIERVLAGQASCFENMRSVITRHGAPEEAWFTFSFSPLRDESGTPVGILSIALETTEKVLEEQGALAERERLTQLFKQAPGFIAILRGPDHIFDFANSSFMQVVGHCDLTGRSVREALPEVEGQGFFELLDRVYHTGEAFNGKGMKLGLQPMAGGPIEEHFIDFVYQPITDPRGRITGIFIEGSDVTERTLSEQAREKLAVQLAEERSRLDTLIEGLPVGVIFMDRDGRLLLSNPALRRMMPHTFIPSLNSAAEEQWVSFDDQGRRLTRDRFPSARALRGETVSGAEFLLRPSGGAPES